MSKSEFVKQYGAIYEHSPWVAERVYEVLNESDVVPDRVDVADLATLMADCVDNASNDSQLALIRAHPDLAGKLQIAGDLTADSTEEQSRAGLDQCDAREFEQFHSLNAAYKDKFGFPFIMAVRNSSRAEILAAFRRRVENNYDEEFETALQQIHRIAEMRLATLRRSDEQ